MNTQNNTQYEREVSFIDAKRNKAVINIEITTRNGYPEFTACGDYNNSLGQCIDRIVPENEHQKELIELWEKWHLNDKNNPLPDDIEETIDYIIESIEEREDERKGESLKDIFENDDDGLLQLIEENTVFTGRDAELCAALCIMFDLSENDLGDIEINDNRVEVQGISYLAGTDSEMDDEWDDYLENYIDECLEIPESIEQYFDREKWKRDAKFDGRGHSLNSYDGGEEEATINGTTYYAYRN